MRIGRDHIASTVYTIAFATAGASLPVLLLIAIYDRPLFQVLQTEQFAEEIIRTLVGSIGLVLAVPLTTAIGVAVVRASRSLGFRPAADRHQFSPAAKRHPFGAETSVAGRTTPGQRGSGRQDPADSAGPGRPGGGTGPGTARGGDRSAASDQVARLRRPVVHIANLTDSARPAGQVDPQVLGASGTRTASPVPPSRRR